jgi:hypothetical protein
MLYSNRQSQTYSKPWNVKEYCLGISQRYRHHKQLASLPDLNCTYSGTAVTAADSRVQKCNGIRSLRDTDTQSETSRHTGEVKERLHEPNAPIGAQGIWVSGS